MNNTMIRKAIALAGIVACAVPLTGCGASNDSTPAGAAKKAVVALATGDCTTAESMSGKTGWCGQTSVMYAPTLRYYTSADKVTCTETETGYVTCSAPGTSNKVKYQVEKSGDHYQAKLDEVG